MTATQTDFSAEGNLLVHRWPPKNPALWSSCCCAEPFLSDSGLGCVACFGSWELSKHDVNRLEKWLKNWDLPARNAPSWNPAGTSSEAQATWGDQGRKRGALAKAPAPGAGVSTCAARPSLQVMEAPAIEPRSSFKAVEFQGSLVFWDW